MKPKEPNETELTVFQQWKVVLRTVKEVNVWECHLLTHTRWLTLWGATRHVARRGSFVFRSRSSLLVYSSLPAGAHVGNPV